MRIKRYKIRFNLGEGENKWKWKITFPDGKVEYHHPNTVQLIMTGCQLHNSKSTAQKIFEGGEKVVCAWIYCEHLVIKTENIITFTDAWTRVTYNPRTKPNWDMSGKNVDDIKIERLGSHNRNVFFIY